ncbi:MAG: hypothetical protein NTV57_09620, partial [Cyanobacteria bacterium]|nr:hypothetical protein [Cyanobacteriota bacterium]
SASEIPAGGMVIAGDLYLKCNRGSSWRQGLKWGHRSRRASRPLNGYAGTNMNQQHDFTMFFA